MKLPEIIFAVFLGFYLININPPKILQEMFYRTEFKTKNPDLHLTYKLLKNAPDLSSKELRSIILKTL